MSKHPMQKIHIAEDGVVRFVANPIVRYLLDKGPFDLNQLAKQGFSKADHDQLAQLIGYSVSGWGDLSFASKKRIRKADKKAEKIWNDRPTPPTPATAPDKPTATS